MKNAIRSSTAALLILALIPGCRTERGITDPESRPADLALPAVHFSEWSVPVNLGTTVNSPFVDFTPEISPDGLSLYFSSDRPGGTSPAPDLWVARRQSLDEAWGVPVNLVSINSPGNDGAPHLSRDGHLLFFTSNRNGTLGSNDVWVSRRSNTGDDLSWGPPENLGAGVNSADFDAGASLWRPEFYFTSDRGPAPLDIYVSQVRGSVFEPGILVEELSSEGNDLRPSIRFDGKEIFLSSDRAGSTDGSQDLWVSTRPNQGTPWSRPENLGPVVNTGFAEQQPGISDDATMLFFASDRPGGSGDVDLWVTTRTRPLF